MAIPTAAPFVSIESDKAWYVSESGHAAHQGHVVMRYDNQILLSERLLLERTTQGHLKAIMASGMPASFQGTFPEHNRPFSGTADNITYLPVEQQLILEGHASFTQNNKLFSGERIEYDVKQKRVKTASTPDGTPNTFIFKAQEG